MSTSTPVHSFSFNDDVGREIDDVRFRQQFSTNTRGLYNHHVDPFARPNLVNRAGSYAPFRDVVQPMDDFQTTCCNGATPTVISGPKSETVPLESGTFIDRELRSGPRVPTATTARIGFDMKSG